MPQRNTITIGKRIKQVRQSTGLNQSAFGKKLGLSGHAPISRYEAGLAIPDSEVFKKIIELSGKDQKWFTEPTDDDCCASCMFSVPDGSGVVCRRYPPVYVINEHDAQFPWVQSDEWCGEYQPKKMNVIPVPLD